LFARSISAFKYVTKIDIYVTCRTVINPENEGFPKSYSIHSEKIAKLLEIIVKLE